MTIHMTLTISRNAGNFIFCVLLLIAATMSCTQFKKLTKKSTLSDKAKELYYSVPAGFKYADNESYYREGSSFLIILPNSNEIILDNPDSPPIGLAELGDRLEEFGSRVSPDKREVFIAASVDVTSDAFLKVLKEVHEHYIDRAQLLVSARKTDEDHAPYKDAEDIPFPAMAFPVKLFAADDMLIGGRQPDPMSIDVNVERGKPNPLTLVMRMINGKPLINGEGFDDLDDMRLKLKEIFQDRERNGVWREGTNEVEQTVHVQIDDRDQRYRDIVSIIDAVKGAGSNRIVLIDAETASPGILPLDRMGGYDLGTPPFRSTSLPKTISGGVLNGKATSLPKPAYPPAAKAVRASGSVSVQVLVSESGSVISANAVSGHPLLRAAATAAARGARFSPTLLSGQPVKISGVLTYNFVPE